MKTVLVVALLCTAVFGQAKRNFTHSPNPRPPQPKIEANDPHTRELLANSEVRVLRIDLEPNESTQMAQHNHDFILVSLGDNDFELAGPANSVPFTMKNEETQVITGHWPHRVVNKASHPLRLVEVAIMKGIAPDRALCGLNGRSCVTSHFAFNDSEKYVTSVLFETPTVRLGKVEIDPSSGMPEHGHTSAHLMIALTDELLSNAVIGQGSSTIEAHPGDPKWLSGDMVHKLTNQGTNRARFLTVEWK